VWNALSDGLVVDLIITDIIMPVMGGKEFVMHVRNDARFDKIPLMVASTIDQLSTLQEFLKLV